MGSNNTQSIFIGDTFPTTNCGIATVLHYKTSTEITVEFDDGAVVVTNTVQLRTGKLHNPSKKLPVRRPRLTQDEAVKRAVEVHGQEFDYSALKYTTYKEKVDIICRTHGLFKQNFACHVAGKSCPSCKTCGYNSMLEGSVYLLKYRDMLKVGITNRPVHKRLASINNSSGYSFEIVASYTMGGAACSDLETEVLRYLRDRYKSPTLKFDGRTETFEGVDTETVTSFIEEWIEAEG